MNKAEPADLELVVGYWSTPAFRGLPSCCLGTLLLLLGFGVGAILHGVGGTRAWWLAVDIVAGSGVALVAAGMIVSAAEESRGQGRARRCLAELKKRHADAEAVILYSGAALPHGNVWKGLLVLEGGCGTLTALSSSASGAVRDAKARLEAQELTALRDVLAKVTDATPPPARVKDGYRATALIFGEGLPDRTISADLAGVTEEDSQNPIVYLLGTLTTTCQQITGDPPAES